MVFLLFALVNFALSQSLCPTNSTDLACASFELPAGNATALSNDLCTQMPFMSTCLLRKECTATPSADFCRPFSSYATICSDMPRMRSCASYNSQCGSSPLTAVSAQCKSNLPLQSFPSTKAVTGQIYSICTEMTMEGCDKCQISGPDATYSNCDIMQVYAQLCSAMPDMSQCESFKQMCSATPSLSWCASSANSETDPNLFPPSMLMYFHTGIRDYILFKEWVPRNYSEYFGYLLASFLFAVFYEGFQVFAALKEYEWKCARTAIQKSKTDILGAFDNSDNSIVVNSKSPWYTHIAGFSGGVEGIKLALIRSLFRLIVASWALLLMLIVMSYNVGLFFAVIIGYWIGNLLFAPVLKAIVESDVRVADPDCC